MNETLRNITLKEFVMRFVSEDVHIRVDSLKTFVTANYDCNLVYEGEAAPVFRDMIDPGVAKLRVLGVEPWTNDTLYIYCE